MENNPNQPKLLVSIIDLIKITDIYLKHAPTHEKHVLCAEIRRLLYKIHSLIIECTKKY